MSGEHFCSATINPCTCGRRWDYVRTYSDGTRIYSDKATRDRYLALYGAPRISFVEVST